VGGGFALSGGADAGIAGSGAELFEVGGTEVAEAGLDTSDELSQDAVDVGGEFLEGFDAFGGDFLGGVGGVAVAGSGAGFHGGDAAHAAVLFVQLAADLDDLAWGFRGAGEDPAADDAVGEREGLDDIA